MDLAAAIAAIDALVKVVTVASNAIGAEQEISSIIAARIAAGNADWTDDQKKQVQDALDAARAYAVQQSLLPDA